MKKVNSKVELSSLPKILDDKRMAVISLSSYDKKLLEKEFSLFTNFLDENSIKYELKDIFK